MAPNDEGPRRVITLTISIPEKYLEYMWGDIIRATQHWATPTYAGPRTITLRADDPIDPAASLHRLESRNWASKGLQVLADRGYHRLGELMKGDYDQESLDCLVQAAIFGDIPYG